MLPISAPSCRFVPKVTGATRADLTIRARRSQLFVCRVNDHFSKWVFSDWAKVKVLDVHKSGTQHPALCAGLGPLTVALTLRPYSSSTRQACRCSGWASRTSPSTPDPRRSDEAPNSPSAASPSASPLRTTSGTEMDSRCWTRRATPCRYGRTANGRRPVLGADGDCLLSAVFTASFR